MNIIDILEKKKNKHELSNDEIKYVIDGYVKEEIPDYQISSLLMAIRLNGMSDKETAFLTKCMVESGETINYPEFGKVVVDKHSTGGVGDKTSLVLIPLLASLDFAVSKMSGRALGYTGGTIDKLESLKGFDSSLSKDQVINQVSKIGCAIAAQTESIVPADKKLYALRDVTSTVDSIPLIASSIMSKKIALGADIIILDVKFGTGAFMQTKEDAATLANEMCKIGKALNRKTIALITSMEEPLGKSVGNAIEVQEAIDTLKNINDNKELKDLCVNIAYQFMKLRDDKLTDEKIYQEIEEKFITLKAYNKFKEMIECQGAEKTAIEDLEISENVHYIRADKSGYISRLDSLSIGKASMVLGAGRMKKGDDIDLSVGININRKIGDYINAEDILFELRYSDFDKLNEAIEYVNRAIEISDNETLPIKLIEEIIK